MERAKETKFRSLTEVEWLHIGLVLVCLILSITGCTQAEVEENDIPFHALKDVEAGFNLHVLDSQTTRSATGDTLQTRAEEALDDSWETKISTLWIGQYDAATGNCMFSQYLESVDDQKAVNVKLKQSKDGTKSHVWFVANSGNPKDWSIDTEKELKAHVLTYSFTDNGLPESQLCGMAGMWEGIVKEGAMKDLTVNLTRLVAKITFTYAIGGSDFTFTPSSVTLNSVPDGVQIAAPETQLMNIGYRTYSGTANNSGATMCWYLPENMAGTATGDNAVSSEKKKTGKGMKNATYIELTGEAVQGGVTYKNVTFRFYPGKDQNNYDIIRNSHYTVNVTLVGIDVSDERITVREIPPVEFDAEKIPAEKGGEKKVQVTARPGQEWSFDMPQWLSALIEGKQVSGGATVTYQGPYQLTFQAAEANPRADDRSAEFPIHINGEDQTVTITQSGSNLTTTGDVISLAATAEATGSSSFTATKGLLWDASLSEDWLDWATDNPSGPRTEATGSPQTLKVKSNSPNPLAAARSGKITVKAGESISKGDYIDLKKEIEVTQTASTVTGSSKTVSAEAHKDLKSSFTVTTGLSWVASVTEGSWINLSTFSGGPATGSDEDIIYSVPVNPNAESRTGNITVRAGDKTSGPTGTITVTQNGSVFDVTGPTEKIDTIAGSKAYGSVTATAGLPWTISQTIDNGITVAPAEGSGSAALTFTATANTGPERTGTFTIMVKDANPERTVTVAVNQMASINNILTINSTVVAKYKEMTTDYILYPPFNYDGGASSGTTGFDRNGVSSNCTLDEEYSIEVEITNRASYSNYAIALSYCKAKGTDWRIPTMIELKAIYDNKATLQKNGCAAFVSNGNYWSSSVGGNEKGNGSDSGRRCRLFFGDSDPDRIYTSGNGFIRCVRDI